MTDVYLVEGRRTAHGALLGALSGTSVVDLGATAVRGVVEAAGVPDHEVDWLVLGHAIQAGVGQVPARQAGLAAGLPDHVPATTVNEASGSGLRAIELAAERVRTGRADVAVAGGMESMSNAPHVLPGSRTGTRLGHARLLDSMVLDALWDVSLDRHMGSLTEDLAEAFDIGRDEQDAYALESHRRAAHAIEEGLFLDEVVPVETTGRSVEVDQGPRPDTTLDQLGRLPPAFRDDGTITAGNASSLSDGAGCVALASSTAVEALSLTPLARVEGVEVQYRAPRWFGMALADAVGELLKRYDLSVEDVDHFELNEAFAAQMLYVRQALDLPPERHNPLGGAVAVGHPIGASGGMLATTLLHAMQREGHGLGIVGMSVGGGGGIAVLLEAVE